MWIFTKYGFVSIVKYKQIHNVRARLDGDIERLFAAAGLPKPEIKIFEFADYAYRAELTKEQLVQLMIFLAEDNDYGNFKGIAEKNLKDEPNGPEYVSALHAVWDVMYNLQSSARAITKKWPSSRDFLQDVFNKL
jgi:hypothetical protein